MFNVKSETRGREILEALDRAHGVVELTASGRVIRANKTFLKILGYTENELIGAHSKILFESRVAKLAHSGIWTDLIVGKSGVGEFSYLHKDGHSVVLRTNYIPLWTKTGKVTKVIMLALEVQRRPVRVSKKDLAPPKDAPAVADFLAHPV